MKESHVSYVEAPLLTVPEAAKHLGVGRKVVYRLMGEGRLTVVKAGRATMIDKRSVDGLKDRGELT